jgi:hypothetical protein
MIEIGSDVTRESGVERNVGRALLSLAFQCHSLANVTKRFGLYITLEMIRTIRKLQTTARLHQRHCPYDHDHLLQFVEQTLF